MDRKRSKKVKSLRAAGTQPVNKEINALNKRLQEQEQDTMVVYKGLAAPFVPDKVYKCVRRFTCTTNFTGSTTIGEGCQQFMVANSSTTCVSFVDIWRMKRIKVYARNNEQAYGVSVFVTPNGADTGDNFINSPPKHYCVESQSDSFAMVMDIKPCKNQPWGMWHRTSALNNSGTLFTLQTASGGSAIDNNTIFEIEYEFQLNTSGVLTGFSLSGLSGLTVGHLLGSPLFGGLLQLVGTNSI